MRDDVVFKDIRALAATAAVFDGRKTIRSGHIIFRIIYSTAVLYSFHRKSLILMVGARRFELPTPCTPCMYATRLRYAPTNFNYSSEFMHLSCLLFVAPDVR